MTSVTLTRSTDTLYLSDSIGAAGSGGIWLGEDFSIEADLEHDNRIHGVFVGHQRDLLQVATVLGFDAAEQIFRNEEEIAVPVELPAAGLLAIRAATLKRLLGVPVLRAARSSWTAELALCASELMKCNLDPDSLMSDSLRRLPPLVGLGGVDALPVVNGEEYLLDAVRLGIQTLDPTDSEWQWFADLAPDIGDESFDLWTEFENTPPLDRADLTPVDQADRTPSFLGGVRSAGRRTTADLPASIKVPLYWGLIEENLLPENYGFDKAVEIQFDRSPFGWDAEINVGHPSRGQNWPALYTRIVHNDTVCCIGALLSGEEGWQGTIPLPSEFDPEIHYFEVFSSKKTLLPPLPDHELAEAEQRGLVEVGFRNVPSHLQR